MVIGEKRGLSLKSERGASEGANRASRGGAFVKDLQNPGVRAAGNGAIGGRGGSMSPSLRPFPGGGRDTWSGGAAEVVAKGRAGGGAALGSSSLGTAVRRALHAVAGAGYRAAHAGRRHRLRGSALRQADRANRRVFQRQADSGAARPGRRHPRRRRGRLYRSAGAVLSARGCRNGNGPAAPGGSAPQRRQGRTEGGL